MLVVEDGGVDAVVGVVDDGVVMLLEKDVDVSGVVLIRLVVLVVDILVVDDVLGEVVSSIFKNK